MSRLDRALVLVLSSLAVWLGSVALSPSHASFSATPGGTPVTEYSFHSATGWHATLNAAGAAYASYYGHTNQGCVAGNPGQCTFTINGNNQTITVATRQTTPQYTCPSGSTLSGSACTCTAPLVQNTSNNGCTGPGTCSPLGQQIAGSSSSSQYAGSAGYSGGLLCLAGCKVYPTSSWKAADGKWYATGPLFSVGSTASCSTTPAPGGSDTPTSQPPPVVCSTGQCPGSVNGVNVCVPCQSGSTQGPPTSEETDVDGQGEQTPGATSTTGDGPSTTCTGNSCTTTTTETKTDETGQQQTTTTSKTESKDDFCTKNPRSALCVTSSFSGTCAGGFSHEGDAIQGAIAKEIHQQNCLMNKATDESAKYDVAKMKTGDQTTALPGNTSVNIGTSSFDTSDSIGGKQCIGSISGTVFGVAISLPIGTYICPHAQNLRLVLLALSFLAGFYIIARRS